MKPDGSESKEKTSYWMGTHTSNRPEVSKKGTK